MEENKLVKMIEDVLLKREKRVLVAVTGGGVYQKEILEILSSFTEVGYQYLLSPAAEQMELLRLWDTIGPKLERFEILNKAVSKADCVVLPSLTRSSLAKMATGVADTFPLIAVQIALMMGKPVLAVDACWNPENERSQIMGWNHNPAYNSMLYAYRDSAALLGVQSVAVPQLRPALEKMLGYHASVCVAPTPVPVPPVEQKPKAICLPQEPVAAPEPLPQPKVVEPAASALGGIVTHQDVMGKESLLLNRKARLTDLAREYISTHKIQVAFCD